MCKNWYYFAPQGRDRQTGGAVAERYPSKQASEPGMKRHSRLSFVLYGTYTNRIMNTFSIVFKPGFKYMGLDMSEAVVIISAESFSEVVNIVQKRMSKKNDNALLYVESIILLRVLKNWCDSYDRTIIQSRETPGSICITSVFM